MNNEFYSESSLDKCTPQKYMLLINIIDLMCGSRKYVEKFCLEYGLYMSHPCGLYMPSNSISSATEGRREVLFRNHVD